MQWCYECACVVRRQESYQRDVRVSSNYLYKRADSYIIGRPEVSCVPQRFDKWDVSCHIGKQRLSQSSEIAATAEQWAGEPWGNSGCEVRGYWPPIGEVHIKGMISVSPGSSTFSCTEKALNSITWATWFSWLITFWLPTTCPLLQNFYISWLPTPTPHLLQTALSG